MTFSRITKTVVINFIESNLYGHFTDWFSDNLACQNVQYVYVKLFIHAVNPGY